MVEIDNTIVSADIFTAHFCCDLSSCRGECCVEGNAGAPLELDEIVEIEGCYEFFKPYMKSEGVEAIRQQGVAVIDADGDLTTPLIDNAECAYSIIEDGTTWCAIEKAWSREECSFRKPISCHLYPIRVARFSNGTYGLQYHRWSICRAAEIAGAKKGEPLFRTLREPLIRRFSEKYYDELEQTYRLLIDSGF